VIKKLANKQIGLLFGVKGAGSISGESGQLILQQLNQIARSIDGTNNRIKITIGINEDQTRQLIQKQLNNISKGLKITIGGNTTTGQSGSKVIRDLTNQVVNAKNRLALMGGNADIRRYANGEIVGDPRQIQAVSNAYQNYTKAVEDARKAQSAMIANQNPQTQQAFIDAVNRAKNAQQQLNAVFSNATAFNKQELSYNKVIARITEYQLKFKETLKNTPQLAAQLEELNRQLSGDTFRGTEADAQNRFIKLTNAIRQAGGETETFGQKVKRVFGEKFSYGVMATLALYLRRLFKEVYQSVVEIDSAITQLSIVTGKPTSELRSNLNSIAKSAKDANTSIKDLLKSMETYSRLGFGLEESESMAKVTNMFANVANTDAKAATDSLTAILKGYGYKPSQLEDIANVLVKIGQEYAISAEELGTGLQTAGATLSVTGTNLEKSVALLAAGNAAMQDADRVATALKTSALRIQGTKASQKELEEMGEDITDLAEGTSKLRDEIKALSGVDIMVSATQYKDMYTIMVELAQVWDKLTQTQRNTILEDIAGKRNSSAIASIILNLKDLENSYKSASNASGTLAKANEVYSDSIEGKIKKLQTTFAEFSNNLLDSNLVKVVIDLGNNILWILSLVAKLFTIGDGIVTKLALITAGLWALNTAMAAFKAQTGIFAIVASLKTLLPYLASWLSGTLKMTAAIKLQTAALWKQVTAWLATPTGMITIATGAVLALGAVITRFTDSWQKEVEAAKKAIEVNKENIKNYQDEIDSLEALQRKLEDAKGDKQALAAIQDELNKKIGETPGLINGEADAYAAAAQKIKDQIAATKELLKVQQEELVQNNSSIFNNNGVVKKSSILGIDWLTPDVSGETMRNLAKQYTQFYSQLISEGFSAEDAKSRAEYMVELENPYRPSISKEEWERYWNEQVSLAYEIFDVTISSYNGFGGESFIKRIIDKAVRSGDTPEEINSIISEISNSPLQSLLNEYYTSLLDPDVDSEAIYKKLINAINELIKKYPELSDTFDFFAGHISDGLNGISDSAEKTTANIEKFSDVFKSLKESTDVLADAYNDLDKGGKITLEHLSALLDAYPELIDYINLENGQSTITKDILKAKFEATKQIILAKIIASRTAIKAELEEQKVIRDTIALTAQKYGGDAWAVSDTSKASELTKSIKQLDVQIKQYDTQEALFKNMSLDDVISGSNSGGSGKTEAEKYFEKLKYKLETNKITQEQYLKELNAAYKRFYNKSADYLEDYAKYSREVYDGFKDMYKDDLNAQKDAWEEKKKAVSDYYSNLREQIEAANDKEDYEKEQSEKRKEIFDLDMKIAELMRDGSERAKARIAELEEERLKAVEDLQEFETNKARKDELNRLEKEQEAEEKKIQDKIDGIQGQLDQLDKDTISVRKAIIDYAKKKGVKLDFAYASGTRKSVGGFGRVNENGIEMISAPDGNGNYINLMPNSYVFSAKATAFLWKLATEHSLPQAMYNSIARSIKTQSSSPSVTVAQPISITMGNIIIQGNADKGTVADIKKQQDNTVRMVLEKIKELQKQ